MEEDCVLSGGAAQSELIKSDDFTTSLENAGTGTFGETKGANLELGDGQHAGIVGDSSDNDSSLVTVVSHVAVRC